jgi:hypothetical protein|tara:strand:- start:4 stop:243 length:240 start_codon:yes stop_codon:yes gene_type:complete
MKKRLRRIYSKRLHLTKTSSLFNEVFQQTLEEYEGRDIEWLRKTYQSAKRELRFFPSIEIQGKLAGLRELGERAKEGRE